AAWKEFGYGLIRMPLSIIEAVPVLAVWSTGLVMATLPAYNFALPGGAAHLGSFKVTGMWCILAALTGLVVLLGAPPVTRAMAVADTPISRWFLGSHGKAELTARIGQLEESRARVIDAAEAERMRIERDLHDGAQQRLVSLAMELGR